MGQLKKTLFVNIFKLLVSGLALAVLLISIIQATFPDYVASMMLGVNMDSYPFTFQTVMWYPFSVGMIWLFHRYQVTMRNVNDLVYFHNFFDSKDFGDLDIQSLDEGNSVKKSEDRVIPFLVASVYSGFQDSTRFNDIKEEVASSSEEIFAHIDSIYAKIRYISWLLPTMGFMGTVYGISAAVGQFQNITGGGTEGFGEITSELAIAFDTTLLSLIQSALMMFVLTFIEEKEGENVVKAKVKCTNEARKTLRNWANKQNKEKEAAVAEPQVA